MALYRDPYARLRALSGDSLVPDSVANEAVLNPDELEREGRRAQYGSRSDFENSVQQGVQDIKSSGYAARGLLRIGVGDEEGGTRDLLRSRANTEAADEFTGDKIDTLEEVSGVGDAFDYAANSLGRLAPTIALSLGTGLAGGAVKVGVNTLARGAVNRAVQSQLSRAVAGNVALGAAERRAAAAGTGELGEVVVSRELQDRAARRVGRALGGKPVDIGEAFRKGSERAAIGAGIVQQTSLAPDVVLDPDGEGSLRERALIAGAGAVATGALDALPIVGLLKRYGINPGKTTITGSLAQRVAKNALEQGASEGATELAQTFGERLTHKFVNDNVDLVGEDAFSDYLNSAAAGFIGGGVFGAPGGLRGQQRESDAGKKFTDSFRDYVGKLRTPVKPVDGGDSGAAIDADPEVAFDATRIVDTLKNAGGEAAKVAGEIGTKIKGVSEQFQKSVAQFMSDVEVENSIDEVLNAAPYEYKPTGTGVMFNQGAGINAVKEIIPAGRVRELRQQFPDMDMFHASASAMIPDALKADELRKSGAIDEAARLLQGEDPAKIDDKLISDFQDALPAENRNAFNRAAHTIWKTKQDDVDVELGAPEVPTKSRTEAPTGMDEEQPLPAPDRRIKDWRSKAGKPITGTPNDALVLVDGEGTRRALPGKQLGRMLVEAANEDPDFKKSSTLMKVAEVLGDFQRNGFTVDPASLRALTLGKGWMLTQRDATALVNGLQPTQAKKATAPTAGNASQRTKTASEEQALNAELGRGEGVDTQRIETEQEIDDQRVLAPRTGGSPRTAPAVSAEGRVTEGQTIDAGEIDREGQRAEREPDDFNALDTLLERHTGEKVNGDFEARRKLYTQVLKEGKRDFVDVKATLDPKTGKVDRRGKPRIVQLSKVERDELIDAAERFAEANREAALRRVRSANKKVESTRRRWQKHKTPETFAEFNAAKKKLASAQRRYDESSAQLEARETLARERAIAGDTAKREANKKASEESAVGREVGKALADLVVEHSADEDSFTAQLDTALRTRSRRHLYAMKDRIARSTLAENKKAALLERVNEEIAKLRDTIHSAGVDDLSQNKRRTVRMDRFTAMRDRLAKHTSLEAALREARYQATEEQQALIDVLVQIGALRGVSFKAINNPAQRSGTVNGAHASGSRRGTTLNSSVTLSFGGDTGAVATDAVAVLLHEAIHAATAHAEQTNAKARGELVKLLDTVREEARKRGFDPDSFYGLSETQEFLAEAFTNDELQGLLRSIPMPGGERTLWDALKDWIAAALGMKSGDQRTALDAVMESGLELAQQTSADRRAAYEAIFSEESPEQNIDAVTATPAAGSAPSDYMSLLNPNERRYLEGAFRRAEVYRQVADALPPDQRAKLASADQGPALLVNTAIALALQGKLDLSHDAGSLKGAVQGLWETVSTVLQVPSKTAYARAVLSDLTTGTAPGKIDAQARLLRPTALSVTRFVQTSVKPKAQALLRDVDGRLRSSGVPALTQLATLLAQRTGEFRGDGRTSYSAAVLAERNKRMNQMFAVMDGWDEATKTRVLKELQTNTDKPSKQAVALRAYLQDMFGYVTGAGVQMGKTENYFPVSIDPEAVAANPDAFRELMGAPEFAATLKERKLTVDDLYAAASARNSFSAVGDTTFADGEHDPTFRAQNPRLMDFVFKDGTPEQIEALSKFQDQNLERVLVQYTSRAVRRAEWQRLNMGPQIKDLMAKAQQQGASPEQMTMAKDYVDMVMGTYGNSWNPMIARVADNLGVTLPAFEKFQRLQGALTTYQNIRLLPLAAMSSLIDPLGVAVRSGGPSKTFHAYREAVRAIRDKSGNDQLMSLAQSMGIVERHAVSEALAHMYGSINDPTGTAAKINSALFRYNGLEYITKFSRLAALAAGNNFIKYHAANDSEQSKRYMAELGLTPDDVNTGADGYVVRNDKIDAALNRFVNEAVVRPTPGQRPAWHNDPNFQMAAQYKGYLYSFFNTVTRRVMHELEHGNASVLLPVLMYLPVTAAGEMLRDLAQGDDEERNIFDYAQLAVVRSGLLGPHVGTFSDVRGDLTRGHVALSALAGPTGAQLGKAYDAAIGEANAGRVVEEALPASSLYKNW